jgi:Tol biopolymer transport system component
MLAAAGLAAACQTDPPTAPDIPGSSFAISDAVHGGMPHFLLLPPLARSQAPTGAFDDALSPTVEICALRGSACGEIIASFTRRSGSGGTVVGVDTRQEQYQVNWEPQAFGVRDDIDYRIGIRVGAVSLGYVDIDVAARGTQFRTIPENLLVPLDNGRTLPIRFRPERGIPGRLEGLAPRARVEVGERLPLQASCYDLHSQLMMDDCGLRWSTSDTAVVTVDPGGVVYGKKPGNVTVAVSVGTLGPMVGAIEAFSRRLAFVSTRAGNFHIYTMDGLGGDLKQLTTTGDVNFSPAWSPNGTRIAFERHSNAPHREEVWIMNADGTGQINLSNTNTDSIGDADPQWSPDGSKIVFHRYFFPSNQSEIYVMKADGSGKQNLSNDPVGDDFWPSWSPDGTRIVFWKGNLPYVVQADGSGPPTAAATVTGFENSRIVWSPSGTRIAFSSEGDILTAAVGGSDIDTLTQTPDIDVEPHWSPDGSQVFYRVANLPGGDQIRAVNADGSNDHLVVVMGTYGASFDLSSDGKRLAYVQGQSTSWGTWEIFKINPDGTGNTNLTNATGKDFMPAWRP